ncbi:hypothetical protein GALMADRAFT_220470 [Galerina marginata CBS 339.88]|uniref:Uncharacterized protein n=1 Tax=Galerina marginata (strain CBS 339.88) TaxID=685588 RepID=A0A067TJI8_GALM3|nr:hypothetical protein GALMADRAFT_220470 [Galerina marginata CBS 339.88]
MPSVDAVLVRLNAQFERPNNTPTIETPKPTQPYYDARYPYHLDTQVAPSGTCTPSSNSTNPSPSSTLSSGATLSHEQGYGLKHFVDFPSFDGIGNLGSKAKPFLLANEISQHRRNYARYQLPFVDFSPPEAQSQGAQHGEPPISKEQTELGPPPRPLNRLPPRVNSRKAWTDAFENATKSRDHEVMVFGARAIVNFGGSWTDDEMLDLARAFVWGASDRSTLNIHDHFAKFATIVRQTFSTLRPNDGLGEKFSTSLRNAAIGTFLHCWNIEDSHKAIIQVRFPTPNQTQFVLSSLAHCNFIGCLYKAHFISRTDTIGCVRVLFQNTSVIEHLVAVRHIIFQAGMQLWRESDDPEAEMKEFTGHLVNAAKGIPCDRAVLPQRPPYFKTVKASVDYITTGLDEFSASMKPGYVSHNLITGPERPYRIR